jgi:hypothetical protein
VSQVIALAMMTGWPAPQAVAIGHYAWRATHLDRHFSFSSPVDPCAHSRLGEGLVDVTANLRGELHRFAAASAIDPRARPDSSCVPAEAQLAYLRAAFPKHYPQCAAQFDKGDLGALQRCWGDGHGR